MARRGEGGVRVSKVFAFVCECFLYCFLGGEGRNTVQECILYRISPFAVLEQVRDESCVQEWGWREGSRGRALEFLDSVFSLVGDHLYTVFSLGGERGEIRYKNAFCTVFPPSRFGSKLEM